MSASYELSERWDTIEIDGLLYPARPSRWQIIGGLAGKVTFGDYTRTSDVNQSSKIWSTFAAGIGVEHIREGSDEGNFWYGTLDGKSPFMLSLNRETLSYDGVRYSLGDFNGEFYALDDAGNILKWDEAALDFTDTTYNLAGTPVRDGIEYNDVLLIPLGAAGVATFTGAANATIDTAVKAVDLLDFDGDLYAVTSDKTLQSFDGSAWTSIASFKWSDTPRRLIVYMNRLEDDILYVATNRGLLAYDKTNTTLIRTRFQVPPHYDNGLGVAVWRVGEDLFYSAGMDVYLYSVSAAAQQGPSGKEGVPDPVRGRVVDLRSSFNALFALVEGATTTTEETVMLDEGMTYDDPLYGSTSAASATLMEWNGSGWHPCWTSDVANGQATWVSLSATLAQHRVFWGYNNTLYTQKLSRSQSNPRQRKNVGDGRFAPTGYLDTGWFDGNMFGIPKLASHLEVNVTSADTGEPITIDYALDNEEGFAHTLGTITAGGQRAILPFGVVSVSPGGVDALLARGVEFDRIRFRIRMETDDPTSTPIMDSLILKYVSATQPYEVTQYDISLTFDDEMFGRTAAEMKAELDAKVLARQFSWVLTGDANKPVYRALITAAQGINNLAIDQKAQRTYSVIEYPLAGYDARPADYVHTP